MMQQTTDPTPQEAARIQAPKKVTRKTTTTTATGTKRVKQTQPTTITPTTTITETNVLALALTLEPEAIIPTVEHSTTLEAPAAPQILPRTSVRGPTTTVLSKSSNNDEEGEAEPHKHINTALIASQPNLPATINPAILNNLDTISSTAPPMTTRSRGLGQPVDMRNDPERPLREQRRRERPRSQSYDNAPLPPLPPMNMEYREDDCIVLNSVASFREIDSEELNSDARRHILSQFTTNRNHYPRNPLIQEEDEDTARISILTRSSPDELQ
ncbi:hypothetical protein EYB25_003856 [Talaromyces marneffei]|nr:hypothetical protein EYB25_003856 [Talaromyces marneffei]